LGQSQAKENDVLILFVDEPVPNSSAKILSKKVTELYEGHQQFEEQIIKMARKNNATLAKIEDYHAPDKKKPYHQGMVSIYSYGNMDSLRKRVESRRDSLDRVQLNESNENSLVYFFRPRSMRTNSYDLTIDGKVVIYMKPDSTVIVKPGNKTELTFSARTYANPNSVTMRVQPGKVYYVECRTIGSPPFSMFPFFSPVDSHVGRYLFNSVIAQRGRKK